MTILDTRPQLLDAAQSLRAAGMSYFDIALRLGVGENTVARWLGPGDRSKCKPVKGRSIHYVSGRRGGE